MDTAPGKLKAVYYFIFERPLTCTQTSFKKFQTRPTDDLANGHQRKFLILPFIYLIIYPG
jgi:hypothetical protein